MKKVLAAILLSLSVAVLPAWARDRSEEMLTIMRLMPADSPLAVVVADVQELDGTVASLCKRLKIEDPPPPLIESIKEELGIAALVDFSKPMGAAGRPPVVWAHVPDATAKIKGLPGAKQENEIWQFSNNGSEELFAKISGEIVIVATGKDLLVKATAKENRSLAEEVKPRVEMLKDRIAFAHFNVELFREEALAGIGQLAPMAPMGAMMLSQQAGMTDPTGMIGALMTVIDAARKLTEQIAYVELSLGLDSEAGRVTFATGYKDGAIKDYLLKQKPGSVPPFSEIEEQPFMVAAAYHQPGNESPFIDYLFEQMKKGMSGGGTAPPSEPAKTPLAETLQILKDLYSKTEGSNVVFSMSPEGMKVVGDYFGPDPAALLELVKKSMTLANPLGGKLYESAGTRKIGDVEVESYALKLPETPGNTAMPGKLPLVGEARPHLGVRGGRVRVCMGSEKDVEQVFRGKVEKPLSSAPAVREAFAKLPAQRNGVLLFDLSSLMKLVEATLGKSPGSAAAASPPVVLSFSVAGHPARLDAYVPIKAVEQLVAALSAQPVEPLGNKP